MIEKIQKQIKNYEMIQQGDCIAAAVSGGADSVCLLLLLKQLQQNMEFTLCAVHVEHGIRGEESKKDAEFVEYLCKQLGIVCVTFAVDACSYAKEQKIGLEEAARLLRYAKFEAFAKEQNAKIALAHHMEDNAETVLFQMLRGSSLAGLGGILPIRTDENEVTYIRPLLTAHRREIEAYLKQYGQVFCTDATNLENDYSRNYLRNIVMPHLEQINKQAVSHINKTAMDILEVRDYMELEAQKQLTVLVEQDGERWYLEAKKLKELHFALQKQLVYTFLAKVAGSKKDITSVHVESLLKLADRQSGKQVHLPYGLIAVKEYDRIFLYKDFERRTNNPPLQMRGALSDKNTQKDSEILSKQEIRKNAEPLNNKNMQIKQEEVFEISEELLHTCQQDKQQLCIPLNENGEQITLKVYENTWEIKKIPKKTYTKWLDYDKIKQGFCIRMRQSGDYFISDTKGHRKKLKQYFIDEKIPAQKRNSIWLLAQGSHIFWITGGRISEAVKVTEATKTIVEINYNGGM